MRLMPIFFALFFTSTFPVFSQVAPAAREGGASLVVGAGVADYYTDWTGRLTGPTVWVDWNFYRAPSVLKGFSLEAEGRDLNYSQTKAVPNLRQDTALMGGMYTWRHFQNFHPYGKFLVGIGSIDFTLNHYPNYKHDTRTVYAPGGGVEYHAWRNIWVRGDYEYQYWLHLFHGHALNPQGATIGASYEFGRARRP